MKAKSIFQCAALLTGLLFLNDPLFATVESDIVGYTTITMEAGKWYQIGVVFDTLDGTQDINQIFSMGFGQGDELHVYDNDTARYVAIRCWKDGSEGRGWYKNDASEVLATDQFKSGQGFFVKKKVAGDVVLKGCVNATSVVSFGTDASPAYGMIAYPYPSVTKINDASWGNVEVGDELHVYDNTLSRYTAIRCWKKDAEGIGHWYKNDASTELATDDLTPGQAFFVRKKTAGKGNLAK